MSRTLPILTVLLTSALPISALGCGRSGEAPSAGAVAMPAAAPAAPPAAVAPAAVKRPALGEQERQRLVGWWLRHDQSYMIVIESVGEDGRFVARYLNPQSVHVSRAEAWKEGEGIQLLLELTDRNYPGNYYELSYDPRQELLAGVYHQLALGEDYQVSFTRFEDETSAAAPPK